MEIQSDNEDENSTGSGAICNERTASSSCLMPYINTISIWLAETDSVINDGLYSIYTNISK